MINYEAGQLWATEDGKEDILILDPNRQPEADELIATYFKRPTYRVYFAPHRKLKDAYPIFVKKINVEDVFKGAYDK